MNFSFFFKPSVSDVICTALNSVNNMSSLNLLASFCSGEFSSDSGSPSSQTSQSGEMSSNISHLSNSPVDNNITSLVNSAANQMPQHTTTETVPSSNGSSRCSPPPSTSSEMSASTKMSKKRKLPDDDHLPDGFKVLPLRPIIKEKVNSKVIDAAVRKTIVMDNCSAIWQYTKYLSKGERGKLAKLITDEYPFLRQSFDPPEVYCHLS